MYEHSNKRAETWEGVKHKSCFRSVRRSSLRRRLSGSYASMIIKPACSLCWARNNRKHGPPTSGESRARPSPKSEKLPGASRDNRKAIAGDKQRAADKHRVEQNVPVRALTLAQRRCQWKSALIKWINVRHGSDRCFQYDTDTFMRCLHTCLAFLQPRGGCSYSYLECMLQSWCMFQAFEVPSDWRYKYPRDEQMLNNGRMQTTSCRCGVEDAKSMPNSVDSRM